MPDWGALFGVGGTGGSVSAAVAALRRDESLTEQERVWAAITLIAERIDEQDDESIVSALL